MVFELIALLLAAASPVGAGAAVGAQDGPREPSDRAALARTGAIIRDAFARGDVAAAMACHDANVEKSFGPGSRLVGKAAVEANLAASLASNRLEFVSNEVESLIIRGDVAVEQTLFAIRGTPKGGGDAWQFRGRTQIVYVRAPNTPCGWATLRELVQPAG